MEGHNTMRSYLKSLLLAAALCHAGFAATTLTLTAPPSATAGSTVNVQVGLTLDPTLTAPADLEFSFGVPVDVTGVSATIGAAGTAAGKTLACSPFTAGSITCILYAVNTTVFANGVVAQMALTLAPTLTLTSEPLTLTNLSAATATGGALAVSVTGAPFAFAIQSPCDLNGDGVTDLKDVLLVVTQALAGGSACTTGDINKDGSCNAIDVQRIANAAVQGGTCKVGP